MDTNNLVRKALVCTVIVLFIGAAVAPTINAHFSKAQIAKKGVYNNLEELEEITVQIFGLEEVENYTISINESQKSKFESVYNVLRCSLDKAKTMEEANEIFENTIESLNEIGLLPNQIDIEEVKQLVTGKCYDSILIKNNYIINVINELNNGEENWRNITETILSLKEMKLIPPHLDIGESFELKNEESENEHQDIFTNSNFLCLIAGTVSNARCLNRLDWFIFLHYEELFFLIAYIFLDLIDVHFFLALLFLFPLIWVPLQELPLSLRNIVGIPGGGGDIDSMGPLGENRWSGQLWGKLPIIFPLGIREHCPGIYGFTGILFEFTTSRGSDIIIGYAPWISIGYDAPSFSGNLGGLPVMNPYTGMQNSQHGNYNYN